MSELMLSWPQLGIAVRAELLPQNRELGLRLCAQAPVTSIQSHAVVAGRQLYFPVRLDADGVSLESEQLDRQPVGRINFEPDFRYLAAAYDVMTEPVPAYPVAQVVDGDLDQLGAAGERIWRNLLDEDNFLVVVVRTPEAADPDPLPGGSVAQHNAEPDGNTTDVRAFLRAETDAVWLDEPADVHALRRGQLSTGAGVAGQYFSPLVMVGGLVRSLAIIEIPSLVSEVDEHPETVEVVRRQARRMLRVPLGVIGYFGLPRLEAALRATDAALDQERDPQQVRLLLAECGELLARYQLWLHQTFPWGLGTRFPTSHPQDLEEKP